MYLEKCYKYAPREVHNVPSAEALVFIGDGVARCASQLLLLLLLLLLRGMCSAPDATVQRTADAGDERSVKAVSTAPLNRRAASGAQE